MSPNKSKALMDSATVPDWILGQGGEENAKKLQAALEQKQAGSLDNTSNTFAFGPGPMTPTLFKESNLDMATLFDFRPCGMSMDILGDDESKNSKVATPMKATRMKIMCLRTYSRYVMTYQGIAGEDQEHMMFLLFWLNEFIFPKAEEEVKPEYMHLAEALNNEVGVATRPFMLAFPYHCLHQITINLLDLNVHGSVWMAQIWLECYFPELGNEELNFLEDNIPATALAISPKRLESTEECFIFFRDYKQREERIWLHSLAYDHPWFEDKKCHYGVGACIPNSSADNLGWSR
ncbi:unnamed protein product [Prunus armeniaca]|uniref:Aminotransferase-like plant mobile domain-containing protein n=1 Tax=Prunus armeniaca TaxID=36596 RepID=A0A6J5WJT8_PRUAR|nr:unnamed protein product [Prunus armeniaca]